jgi:hypothetical protein
MTGKVCPECNGEGVVDQDTEDERRCVARLATDLALSPMTARVRRGLEYTIASGDDSEPANRRWVLESAGASMTPEEKAKFVELFSVPQPRGKCVARIKSRLVILMTSS